MSRRMRIKPRFFVFVLLALGAVAGLVALIAGGGGNGTLRSGSMAAEIEATAVLVRDEMSVSVEKYDRADFDVLEGENIFEGMTVAEVYKWGYTDDMLQSLLSVESEIYAAQKAQLSGIENLDLASIEVQIEQKRAAIRAEVMGGSDADLATLEGELGALLSARAEFLKTAVQPTEELSALYLTEETRKAQLDSYRTSVLAVGNGVISFYFDGYELVLNKDKLETLNPAVISSAVSGTSDMLGGSADNLLYRIANPNDWYIAFVTPRSEALRTAVGCAYNISFTDHGESRSGTAVRSAVSEGGVLNLVEITEDLGNFLSTRKAKVKLTANVDGFIVPLSCVAVKDGVASLSIEGADGAYTVEVDVLAVDEDEACVRASGSGALADGMRCVKQ